MSSISRRALCKTIASLPAYSILPAQHFIGSLLGQAQPNTREVNYMLRYFMRSESVTQQTEGLIEYCDRLSIREVMLFSGNQWDMGWNLPTLKEARDRAEILRPVVRRLREKGLICSINMWTSIGHADLGRDETERFDWQFMVGEDGTASHTAACPIDPEFQQYLGQLYGVFAQLEPEIIYIDDDFRYHNHRPVSWGCFCPLHLAEMERRTGKQLKREELLFQILNAKQQPTQERDQWLSLSGDSILELAQIISKAVFDVSPQTHIGLMCSSPNTHAAEGRRWMDMAKAFAVSGNKPVLRPNYASYQEVVPSEAATYVTNMRKLQPLLGEEMRITPELENYPNTRFSKSGRLTRLQMALSFFLAGPDITLDIHSFVETGFSYDNVVDKVLTGSRQYFGQILDWTQDCPRERGLQILWDERFPRHRMVDGKQMADLQAPTVWEGTMDLLGFATTFYSAELGLANRSYLEERTASELKQLLEGKLLIDGDAAAFLLARGFGPKIGLNDIEPVSGANYERMTNPEFAGEFLDRDETIAEADKYRLDPYATSIEVSRMYGPEASFSFPGMTLFENSEGGRIGIIPQNGSAGDFQLVDFRGWKRQHVLRKMLEWINRGPLPLFVENAPNVLPMRKDGERSTLIGIANLAGDPLENVKFKIATPNRGGGKIELLNEDGVIKSAQVDVTRGQNSLYVQSDLTIRPMELACFRLG